MAKREARSGSAMKEQANRIVNGENLRITLRLDPNHNGKKDKSYKVYDIFVNGHETPAWLYVYKGSTHSSVGFRTRPDVDRSLLHVTYQVK